MNRQLPVPYRQPSFTVDAHGQVARYEAPPPPARQLSRPERLDAYRAGIGQTAAALRQLGFVTHYECEHSVSMEFRGYLFDFRIQRPDQVAHITSRPGGRPSKPNVSIFKLSDEIQSEFALQMMIGKKFSARPVFVALEEGLTDPAQRIKEAVLTFLASLSAAEHLDKACADHVTGSYKPQPLPDWLLPR